MKNNTVSQPPVLGMVSCGTYKYPDPMIGIKEGSIVYSAGTGTDASHDVTWGLNYPVEVVMIDPSPHSIEYANQILYVLNNGDLPPGEEPIGPPQNIYDLISTLRSGVHQSSKFTFLPVGLYSECGTATFYRPATANDIASYSMYSSFRGNDVEYETFEAPVHTIKDIMNRLGHKQIDVLKIDVEGVEYGILEQALELDPLPKYITCDFDLARGQLTDHNLMHKPNDYITALSQHFKAIKRMLMFYIVFHSDDYDVTFMRKDIPGEYHKLIAKHNEENKESP